MQPCILHIYSTKWNKHSVELFISDNVGRQLNRLMVKVAPWNKLNIVFKPVLRLKALSKLKSAVQT